MHACARAFVRLCQALASTGRPCGGGGARTPSALENQKCTKRCIGAFWLLNVRGALFCPDWGALMPENVQKVAPTISFVLSVLIARKFVGTREAPVYAVFSLFSLFSLLFSGWRGYRAGWLARRCTFSGVCAAPLGLSD